MALQQRLQAIHWFRIYSFMTGLPQSQTRAQRPRLPKPVLMRLMPNVCIGPIVDRCRETWRNSTASRDSLAAAICG